MDHLPRMRNNNLGSFGGIMKPALIFILIIVAASSALARSLSGGSDRGGGDGIYINDQLYLLDLVEAGAQSQAPVGHRTHAIVHDYIAKNLAQLNLKDAAVLEDKLLQMKDFRNHENLFFSLLVQMKSLNWSLVNVELNNVEDEDSELLCNDKCVQLAVRREGVVYINRPNFEKLNANNQAALIIHELAYALTDSPAMTSSLYVRTFVGFFFASPVAYKSYLDRHGVFGPRYDHRLTFGSLMSDRSYESFHSPYLSINLEREDFGFKGDIDFNSPNDYLNPNLHVTYDWICDSPKNVKLSVDSALVSIRYSIFENKIVMSSAGAEIDGRLSFTFTTPTNATKDDCKRLVLTPFQELLRKAYSNSHFQPF